MSKGTYTILFTNKLQPCRLVPRIPLPAERDREQPVRGLPAARGLRRRARRAEGGDELTDEQIKYLHLERRWSPTRIADWRGVRGRKQARLERVYTALGLRRELAEVEQHA